MTDDSFDDGVNGDTERRFQTVVEHAPHAMIMIDRAGRIAMMNQQAVHLFGYTRSELLGQPLEVLIPERFRADHPTKRNAFAQNPSPRPMGGGRDLRALRKDGSEVSVEIGLNPMPIGDEGMIVADIVDISARKDLEAELRRANLRLEEARAELERSNRELEDFAHIAAHDLKAPLRGINTYANFLRMEHGDALGDEGLEHVGAIQALTKRAGALMDGLLRYSRVGGDAPEDSIDLDALVDRVLEDLRPSLMGHGVTARRTSRLPVTRGRSVQLEQLFTNLISNAIKYNDKAEKWVEIGCADGPDGPVYHVRDNGIGIEERHHAEVFQIFRRVHPDLEGADGSGVGLTICKKIVGAHGGRIWIESVPGEGTAVHFTLGATKFVGDGI